jgi:parvulin-like peptidyl-prolyl isomerase
MIGETRVGETEVLHYYNTRTSKEAELTDDLKLAIEAMIRKSKMDEFEATLRDRLRENVEVNINEQVLSSDYDERRSDADVVATYDSHRITWSQVKDLMQNANRNASETNFYISDNEERLTRLQQHIDNAIMALKGRAAGLENDPSFLKRAGEYRKARLINEHRNGLIHSWNPSEAELSTYFADNMDKFGVPEARRVQMLIARTREEAEAIKAQIDKGEMTLGQAAQQLSIDPNAKYTQGDVGWIRKGAGFEGLETTIFNMTPEVVSDPVESHAGWHLIKVLAVVKAQPESLDNPQTRERVFRAYMQERLNDYVVDLRKNHYEVIVYNDELQRQFQREAEFIAELNRKAQQQDPVSAQPLEELQEFISTPPAD